MIETKIIQKNVIFDGLKIKSKGEKKSLDVSGDYKQKYDYNSGFAVNLGYSFEEYSQLEREARNLVKECKGKGVECVQENKKNHWKFCGSSTKIFCVNSPNEYKIKNSLVVYEFALDFGSGLLVS